MATLVRIDDLYINLDTVTRIEVLDAIETVRVSFNAMSADSANGLWIDQVELHGEQGARLLKWLDAGGRASEA